MKALSTVGIILLASLFAGDLSAQVKVGVNATGKHAKVVNTAKRSKEEVKAAKERAGKIKEQKKAVKKYNSKYKKLKSKRLKDYKKDSLQVEKPVWNKADSLALAEEILEHTNFPENYRELIVNPIPIDSTMLTRIDSSAYNPEKLLEEKAKDYLPDELNAEGGDPLSELPSNPLDVGTEEPTLKKPSKLNPNLVKPEAARELFKKIDPEKFQKVQADIAKLKKKYSSLPDSRFPEEGTKRNSLEDLPFKERLSLGGTLNASSTDPLIIDTNLQLGYWINKKWMAGVGLILREQFNNRDSTSLTGDAHGFSLFMRYDITKQFYVWGESQRQVNRSLINRETTSPAKWQEAYLIGIGREFKIGPVRMTSLVMYDFNYQSNDLNLRPLVFRLGFQISKKP